MLLAALTEQLKPIMAGLGLPEASARVTVADRPDLADVQCNGALQGAKALGQPPRAVAEKIVAAIQADAGLSQAFREITIAGPGFINFKLAPTYMTQQLSAEANDSAFGVRSIGAGKTVLLEYCSPNVAKEMHIGHLRNTMIGDSIRRLLIETGYKVVTDNHIGDWGLPMGLCLAEVELRHPDWIYFKEDFSGPYPAESPVTLADLGVIYPAASQKSKDDPAFLEKAQIMTAALQKGRPGYRALWQHFLDVTVTDLKEKLLDFGVPSMDTWYGESYMDQYIPFIMDDMEKKGLLQEVDGAIGVTVQEETDKFEIPPLIMAKRVGGVTYSTTDVATFYQRQKDLDPDICIILTDFRQELHFVRVYRAAKRAGYAERVQFEHVMYGTINGADGKPLKTRGGNNPSFEYVTNLVREKAVERLREIKLDETLSAEEFQNTAKMIGDAAIKFGDLINHRRSDYIFDLDKFVSFEGKTGPYLQYTVVRLNALLQKAKDQGVHPGAITLDEAQHDVALLLLQFGDIVTEAANGYAPNVLCDYLFRLGQSTNRYYQNVHILSETDPVKQGSALALLQLSARILTQGLSLIGIMVPARM